MVAAPAKKIDITQHVLVPSHQKLSAEEAKQILEKYDISAAQLPAMLVTDPIAKALGANVGDLIKVERKGPLQSSPYYRRVVE
jgi:DNA-directed RNA polymerase subunit H